METTKDKEEIVYCPICKEPMEKIFNFSDPKPGKQYRCKDCKIQSDILEWGEVISWGGSK
jgi:transposase-like protein